MSESAEKLIISAYEDIGYTLQKGMTASYFSLVNSTDPKEDKILMWDSSKWVEAVVDKTKTFQLPLPTNSYTTKELLRLIQIDKII